MSAGRDDITAKENNLTIKVQLFYFIASCDYSDVLWFSTEYLFTMYG